VSYSNISEIFNYSEEDLKPYRNNFLSDASKQVAQLLDTDRRTVDVFKLELGASVRSLLRIPPVCYTVNLMRNQTKRSHEFIPTTYTLFFPKIYLYAEDIIYGPEYAAIQASVHSPYSYANPFIAGFELKIGKFYTFRVKQVEKNLLPWPYKTNCFNYLEKIKQNGKPGPANQKECVENCKVNLSLKMLGCVLRSIWYPHNYRRCEPRNERDLLSYYHKNCSQRCQPACS
ncbi:uncharacterized protein LOC118180741, partial [Stegodyphus dumicola]|uniref:uncharacterized protein LOC118180741 n=1 Tax=Stegodyphus dumicola TaxID=202533 RepID=UPI0015B2B007